MRRQSHKTLAATALVALLATGGLGHAQEPIKIGIPVGLSGANSVVAPSVVQAGRARRRGDQRRRRHARPEGGAGRRRRRQRRARARRRRSTRWCSRRRSNALISMETSAARNAGLPIVKRGKVPVHLHLVLRGPLLQPLDVRERLGAGPAGGADRRPFHEGVRRQELLPDRQRLRLRPRHARVHAASTSRSRAARCSARNTCRWTAPTGRRSSAS